MKMSKKKLLAITLTLTTFLAMFAVLRPGVSTEYIDVDDYCWIEGVLHSDTYALYPYAQESIDIGFSKYAEMIGYNEDTAIGLGMQYPGYTGAADEELAPDGTYDQTIGTSVDPFCNEEMPVDVWMNGWFIDIKYTPLGGTDREIWAFALFSDSAQHGGDWITMPSVTETSAARTVWQENPPYANPSSTAYSGIVSPLPESGGRKTNGHCETEPLEIIYNGPRRLVAICKTKVSDVSAELVDLTFTFIFNKVEKNVIILKDIKWLYKKGSGNIAFGNRGEWDLGISPDTASYVHWYTDEPVQYFNTEPDTDPTTINTTEIADSFEFFKGYMLKRKCPKKWWDEVPASEIPDYVYDEWTGSRKTVATEKLFDRYTDKPSWNETQPTCYGREWHMDKTIKEHSYAVAQVISKAGDYVGALAVWPHPEFWGAHYKYYPPKRTTTTGGGKNPESLTIMLTPLSRMLEWNKWTTTPIDPEPDDYPHGYLKDRSDVWVKADDAVDEDGDTREPLVPFTIYEHDFELGPTIPAYRIASVYMLTDRHDADDADAGTKAEVWSDGKNWIDREIQYQLDEIFNPWDIYDAMHKNTKRWTQFFDSGVEFGEDWVSGNIKAWDGLKYSCIELDSSRMIETGKTIPSLPVYPGSEPTGGVRPTDWDGNHGLCWDAYCAFTERVLVDDATGSGYELIPRAVGEGVLTEPDDYKPSSLTSYNFLDPTPSKTRHYYTINFTSGRMCFYEYGTTEVFEKWYLPKNSVVKVLWSSEHNATTADQWDENDLLYPIDGDNFQFPLHHDIMAKYKNDTEVFHDDLPISGGDYVFHNATKTLYMQDPLAAGQWLLVNYTVSGDIYANFFLGTLIPRTAFTLQTHPDGSLNVSNTEILQQIVNDTETPGETALGIRVPKEDCFWTNKTGVTSTYVNGTWHKFGTWWEEREWLNCTDTKERGHWIIRETGTCDELVIDDSVWGILETWGDATAEWTTEKAYSGRYSAKLTTVTQSWDGVAGVKVLYNKLLTTIDDDSDISYWIYSTVAQNPYAVLYLDTTGDGEVDFWLHSNRIGDITKNAWVNSPAGYQDTWIPHIYSGGHPYGQQGVAHNIAYWQTNKPGAKVIYVGIQYGNVANGILYVDDITINGVTYPLPPLELKTVFKVPSGRYEWGTVGKTSAAVDSIGSEMVVAAFKNKLIEFGLGGLDITDSVYGPRIPWMVTDTSPDTIGRYHLFDDWCTYYKAVPDSDSWPISSSNIITTGGPYPNMISKYFNEFAQAMTFCNVDGVAGADDGFYAVTCWDKALAGRAGTTSVPSHGPSGFYDGGEVTDRFGHAVISTYKDKNGTIGFMVYGWTGQDTYYAAKWFDENKFVLQHLNLHVTDLILRITYKDSDLDPICPPTVSIVEELGTISEKPQHDC